ncbi:LacI family DNA-binding transcriptional regulator [Neglectibacter timonensis]|uniref:LacI family DNA-binding transcriptional regulator n=1 Tax=Neglectibacter timonensis TaxID=1776382 RepID=UPI003C6DD701
MAKKPTIREVAKAARVSVATVSRVLNGQQGFSSQTERQVRQVVKEMGYSGGGLARAVKNKVPKTIALIVPEVSEYFLRLAGTGNRGCGAQARLCGDTLQHGS